MFSYAIPIRPNTAPYFTICKHMPSHVLKHAKVGDYCQDLFWAEHQISPEFLHALAKLLCIQKALDIMLELEICKKPGWLLVGRNQMLHALKIMLVWKPLCSTSTLFFKSGIWKQYHWLICHAIAICCKHGCASNITRCLSQYMLKIATAIVVPPNILQVVQVHGRKVLLQLSRLPPYI